jgi:hypothetical protein
VLEHDLDQGGVAPLCPHGRARCVGGASAIGTAATITTPEAPRTRRAPPGKRKAGGARTLARATRGVWPGACRLPPESGTRSRIVRSSSFGNGRSRPNLARRPPVLAPFFARCGLFRGPALAPPSGGRARVSGFLTRCRTPGWSFRALLASLPDRDREACRASAPRRLGRQRRRAPSTSTARTNLSGCRIASRRSCPDAHRPERSARRSATWRARPARRSPAR